MNPLDLKLPVSPGDVLAGKYRVDRVLGAGGMGVVVAATHEDLDQKVAIKLLLPTMLENADLVRRFLREGRAAAKLKSEHVAKVIDVGRLETGAPYMVLEYLDGGDLSEVLKSEGPLPVATAVRFILQAIEAVAEAHAVKIIHRDLKPQNLFLTHRVNGEPLVKVLDFGISKALEEASAEFALTRSQSLLGSPLYMSPEQMRSSKSVDERSDIWSIGVLLHELLTARHPFESDTIPGLVFQVTMEDPTPIRTHRADVAEGIEAIIARCLAKKPDDRYPNVAELARDLEPFGGDAVRGLAASIATVLRAQPSARAAYASFSDISGVTDNPLGPTLDVRSDPSLSGKLSSSQRISAPSSPAVTEPPKPSEVPRARDTSEPVGASSAWGNTQNGVPPVAPRKPAWVVALGALGLVGLGVGIALAATSRPAPNAGAQVAALSAGSPSGVASVAPSVAPAPPKAEPSSSSAVAVAVSSEPSAAPAPSASAIAPSKPGSAKAVKPGAAPSVAAQPSAAPTPSAKPTTKPASSGPPGFVPYGE
ncbi:MAG: protein kinase [Myxococcales bacterium]|nr:protein kinase [Myxococcales bacterium]